MNNVLSYQRLRVSCCEGVSTHHLLLCYLKVNMRGRKTVDGRPQGVGQIELLGIRK